MNMFYDIWYKRFGIRIADHLMNPPRPKLEALDLPKKSILHYIATSPIVMGPDPDDFLFRNITRPIMVSHITENGDSKGNPRKLAINPQPAIRNFHSKHRRFRWMKTLEASTRDPNTLVIYNYGFIQSLYRYARSYYSEYYKWWNTQAAVWENIGNITKESDRENFLVCRLPIVLPSISDLRLGSNGISQHVVKIFNNPDSLMILELWKWFGPHRNTSVLSHVPIEGLSRVNFVYIESNRWFVVNLGKLNSWRIATEEERQDNPEANDKGFTPDQIQKRFLRLMMALFQARSAAAPSVTEEVQEPKTADSVTIEPQPGQVITIKDQSGKTVEVVKADEVPVVITAKAEIPKVNKESGVIETKSETKPLSEDIAYRATRVDRPDDTGADIKHDSELEAQLDADLAELEEISKAHIAALNDPDAEIYADKTDILIDEPVTLEDGVMRICDRLADNGLLSGAEYHRYEKLAQGYKTMKAPDGKSTMEEFIKVKSAQLAIESTAINDTPTIIDKTMLKSSLHEFDSKYIGEIMGRDIAGMAMNIQKAGIAVNEYSVERDDNVLGSSDLFTLRVTPVEGTTSTLRFKLPVVHEDGSYQANGVRYRLRKQRGDLPIRKVGPDRVALTSYYGKVFVNRSSKRVNDYGQWIRNIVMAKGLDTEDQSITGLHPSDVFDNLFKAPKLYTALAMGFRGFILTAEHPESSRVKPHDIAFKPREDDQVEDIANWAEVKHSSVMTQNAQPKPPKVALDPTMTTHREHTLSFDVQFDHTKRIELYGAENLAIYERDGALVVGVSYNPHEIKQASQQYLVMDANSHLYIGSEGTLTPFGTIEDILELDYEKAPIDFAELKVLGRTIPIGIVLGYEIGLDKLIRLLKVIPRRVPAGTRVNLQSNEYPIVFSDETLVFPKENREASMILAGFNEYHKSIRQFNSYEFDKRGIYLNILESGGATTRYLREIDLLYQMFIDPITRDLLIEMKEPLNFRGLLLRSCELLLSDRHPDELDPRYMRIKGYERMAGAVYDQMVKAIRSHNGRIGKTKLPIDLNPYAVWKSVMQDPSAAQVSDINPVQNLKEMEAVTYSGVGGRNSRSMTKNSRSYHERDMGTISESTSDSSDVAINTYLSADPQFTSLRGMSRPYVIDGPNKTGATALVSTSALLSPASDRDDPKRVNFIGIQNGHVVSCSDYRQPQVRTGYEQVIAHRAGDLFAVTAKKPGKVISVGEHGIVIQYEGEDKPRGYEIGRRFGNAAGLVVPHSVITEMKAGQEFKVGDVICYNKGFFEKDLLNPNNIVWKSGIMVKTALMESTATLEDSSALSAKAAKLLTTETTKVKFITVTFDQSIRRLVKVGDKVNSEDILCVIEDAITANQGLFDEESLDTLRILSAQTPQAKAKGVVERIEIFYHGFREDMSESLQAIAATYDRESSRRNRAAGKPGYTGEVDEGFRIEGEPLALDTMAIKIYITGDIPAGVGDKGVFCNQMKTVFGQIMQDEVTTETGVVVDAIFGALSIANRIVCSPDVIGTTATLLNVIAKKAVKAYKGK